MGLILDTSVIIAAERGTLRLEPWLRQHGDDPVGLAAITASELLHGCHRAGSAAVRARRSAFVEAILDLIPVLAFGLAEARRHAELWAELTAAGTVVGPHDMIIAATAVARGDELATLNAREFRRVPGLRLASLDRYRT
ncbi:MAG TPA: type II toxin-antitoxin system VapC family toxin [Gemmatimonadales bacterium]